MATEPMLGEIGIFPYDQIPSGWQSCDGQLLPIRNNQPLFSILGNRYGGDGQTTFALPDLRGRTPLNTGKDIALGQNGGEEKHALTAGEMAAHAHQAYGTTAAADNGSPTGAFWASNTGKSPYANNANASMASQTIEYAGGGTAHENMSPYLALKYAICTQGIVHTRDTMLGEIVMFAGQYIPEFHDLRWLPCDGRTLKVIGNQGLYALLGLTFGGDNGKTFNLPDLRGIAAIQPGQGEGLTKRVWGQGGGAATVTLTEDQLAEHAHVTKASDGAATTNDPTSATWAVGGETRGGVPLYSANGTAEAMNADAMTKTGGGAAHNNMPPFLGVSFFICINGDFPPHP